MGLPNETSPFALGAAGAPYEIEQSLRFNKADTPYLNKVFTTAGDEQKFTISFWFKTTNVGNSTASNLAGAGDDGNNYFLIDIEKASVGEFLHIFNYTPSTGYEFDLKTTRLLRDSSAWMHLVLAVDTTQATASDRAKVWLNGVRETSFTTENYPNQNRTTMWWGGNTSNGVALSSQETAIGRRPPGGPEYANAYIAEFNSIDGQYLTHEDFGEFDDNGVWRPIKYTGTYTGNSFYLKFDAADVDGDSSGLGNDFTANNFTTSGTDTDVMSDTPTTNWCTLNPVGSTAASQCSNGNLEYYNGTTSAWRSGVSSFAVSSGKWYFEAKFTNFPASSGAFVGVSRDTVQWVNNLSHFGQSSVPGSYGYYSGNGNIYDGSAAPTYASTYSTNDIIGCALDLDAGTLHFYKNGVDQGEAASGLTGTWNFGVSSLDTPAVVNFGQRVFEQTPPTGFKALNSRNLSAPDIADGSKYFNTVLYDGTNTSNSITGVGFSPDFVWIKPRDNADHHRLNTTTQGANRTLSSNLTGGEYGPANAYLDSFDSDGFTVSGSDNGWNNSSHDYVAWNWKEGAIPGFEIVTYTGNGYPTSNTQNISHNLGVAPSFITIKNRDRDSQWLHYVKPLGATKGMEGWHDGDTAYTNSNYFANTEPTSAQFTVGSDSGGNWQGDDFIAFLWAEVEGFFKVGTYERNGSTDGPFIYLGFTPALIIIKEYESGGEGWPIYDNKRLGYNPNDTPMFINATTTETYIQSTYPNEIDFLSNGFKIRNNDSRQNSTISSYRYLYWAWAVNPFGGSGVSPATAR